MQANKIFISLDLELNKNTDENDDGYCTDIIQIGACAFDFHSGQVYDTFNRYIKLTTPMNNGELRLSKFITKLTGITDKTIQEHGVPIEDAVRDLYHFCHTNEAMRNGVQWGHDDFEELHKQYLSYSKSSNFWYFAKTQYDVKKLYQFYRLSNGQSAQSGLAKSILKLGIEPFKGKKHNALDDALNTARVFLRLKELIGKTQDSTNGVSSWIVDTNKKLNL